MACNLAFLNFLISFVLLYSSVAAQPQDPYIFNRKIVLPSPAFGPDSIAFTEKNPEIAYVSVSDGRILKLFVKTGTFQDFAYTSWIRTKLFCDGNNDGNIAKICGKVFGLAIDNKKQILYAVDAYRGLFSIQLPIPGLARFITNTAGGKRIKTSNGIDVDPSTGDVYLADASLTLDYSQITTPGVTLDKTGRLIKYSPKSKNKDVTVLLEELDTPSGPAVSIDGSFVLIPLLGNNTIIKYYINGPKAKTTEIVMVVLGAAIRKIKRAYKGGEFWVAVTRLEGLPSINKPFGYRFNSGGGIVMVKDFSEQIPNTRISVVQETNSSLFVGSRLNNYITQYYS